MAIVEQHIGWQPRQIAVASLVAASMLVVGGTGGYLLRAGTGSPSIVPAPSTGIGTLQHTTVPPEDLLHFPPPSAGFWGLPHSTIPPEDLLGRTGGQVSRVP